MLLVSFFFLEGIIIRWTPREQYKLWRFVFPAILAYLAFHIEILEVYDLYRHHGQIDLYRVYGIEHAISSGKIWSNTLTVISYWLFSFFKNNNWYQAVFIFLTYLCLHALIWEIAKDNNYDQKWLCKCTLSILLCFNFYQAVFSVRMWVVFAVFSYCCYLECVRKRKQWFCYIIYIGCLFYHYATVVLLIARLAAFYFSRFDRKTSPRKLMTLIISTMVIAVATYVVLQSPLGELIHKRVDDYSTYNKRGTWQTIVAWTRMLTVFVIAVLCAQRQKNDREYLLMVFCVFIVVLLEYSNYQLTLRFGDGMIALAPCLIRTPNNPLRKKHFVISIEDALLILAIVVNVTYTILADYTHLHFAF